MKSFTMSKRKAFVMGHRQKLRQVTIRFKAWNLGKNLARFRTRTTRIILIGRSAETCGTSE